MYYTLGKEFTRGQAALTAARGPYGGTSRVRFSKWPPTGPLPISRLRPWCHRGEHWRCFARDWRNYEVASKLAEEKQKVRVAALLNVIGDEANDMYDTLEWGKPRQNRRSLEEVPGETRATRRSRGAHFSSAR